MKDEINFLESSPMMTVGELASYLRVSPQWIYQNRNRQRLPYVEIGNCLRFDVREIRRWLNRQTPEPRQPKTVLRKRTFDS